MTQVHTAVSVTCEMKKTVIALNAAEITREGEGKRGIPYTTRRPFLRH